MDQNFSGITNKKRNISADYEKSILDFYLRAFWAENFINCGHDTMNHGAL